MLSKNKLLKSIIEYKERSLVCVLAVVLIIAAFFTPSLYSFNSFSTLLSDNAVYGILAVGVFYVLLTGGIDISVGSILAVSGVATTSLMVVAPDIPAVVLLLIGIIVGCACGFINGFLVGKLKIVPLIATLATMYIYRGLAYVICGGRSYSPHVFTESFSSFATTSILGINSIVFWLLLVIIATGLFLGFFKSGRKIYAVGTSELSSKISGINTDNVKLVAYTLCGACAGLAGMLFASNYQVVSYDIGGGYEMTAIAICILGGVSITGGSGRIDGVVLGALIISITTYMLNLIQGFGAWHDFLQGIIILVALGINLSVRYVTYNRSLNKGRLK